MVDRYCERLGPGLWAEPVNALTNLGFLLAAWAGWLLADRSNKLSWSTGLLIVALAAVGIGSSLFHTFATPWARLLDIVPILLFQLYFLWLYLAHVVNLRRMYSALAVVGFLVAALVGRLFPAVLNGSLMYLPALVLLVGLGIYHYGAQKRERLTLVGAAGIFSVSLVFRAIDESICPAIPLGSHFLWHVLSAVVLYLASRGLILNWPDRQRIPAAGTTRFNRYGTT